MQVQLHGKDTPGGLYKQVASIYRWSLRVGLTLHLLQALNAISFTRCNRNWGGTIIFCQEAYMSLLYRSGDKYGHSTTCTPAKTSIKSQ